jgi:hypothetical protein
VDISKCDSFSTIYWANDFIIEDFQKSQKDKVEYLQPDATLVVHPEPNPPPRVP